MVFGKVTKKLLQTLVISKGTPCIIFNNSGPSQLLKHKKTGFIADINKPQSLADGINWFLNLSQKEMQNIRGNKISTIFQEPMTEDEVKQNLINELIETESFALMQDDLDATENLIIENSSLKDISEVLNKKINSTNLYSTLNYEFDLTDPQIKDYLFSSEANIDKPYAIELSDRVIIMSVNMIKEPELQNYDSVEVEVNKKLSNLKAIEKISLLSDELNLIENLDDKQKFIDTYTYVTEETFVGVKRYSSLMPREVLTEVFNNKSGSEIAVTASNGDKYIIDINKFNPPDDLEIEDILNEYTSFSENVLMTKMSQIINEDVFDKARVNLSNLAL